jgi:hypothetical protein
VRPKAESHSASSGASSNLAVQIAEAFEARSNLPKINIRSFSGKTSEINRFMHSFDIAMAENRLRDQAKLLYLGQFCIKHCILPSPEEGYPKAQEELRSSLDHRGGIPEAAHRWSQYQGP